MWPVSKLEQLIAKHFGRSIDKKGEDFFVSGQRVVTALNDLAQLVRRGEFLSAGNLYSASFKGTDDLSETVDLRMEQNRVRRKTFRAGTPISGRDKAIEHWKKYLASFVEVEELSLHLDEIEALGVDGSIQTVIRMEVIAQLYGEVRPGVDRVRFSGIWKQEHDRLVLVWQSLLDGKRILCDEPFFVEVGEAAGIDFRHRFYPRFLTEPLRFGMIRYGPGGISAVDFDNNGLYDLFIPDGVHSRLFRNRGDGSFEDVTVQSGLSDLDGVSVATFADYDNDGWKDLFVSRTFRPNQLFHNNGDGSFSDATRQSRIGEDFCTTVAAWADYDKDGFLDLYVGRYLDPRKDIPTTFYARNGEPNQLYHNNGDGTFTNVTAAAGVGERGLCLGVVWGDFNNDGYPDLYVVNDFGRKTLYRNNGNGTFTDITVKSGTLAYGAGMSASFVDYDNDGNFDLYVTHIRSDHAWFAAEPTVRRYMLKCIADGTWRSDFPLFFEIARQSGGKLAQVFRQMASGNTLLRNRGDGTFEDVSSQTGANPPGWFWSASFADFDNDGWQDAYMANGWVYNEPGTEIELDFLNNVVTNQRIYKTGRYFDPEYFEKSSWHGWERNRYLHNNGDGTFSEIGPASGTDLIRNSRGVAVADFWNRGVMDIAVSSSNDRHSFLRNQVGLGRNWFEVELVGTRSNRDAVGARVSVLVNGGQQFREVVLGDGYGSQNSMRQHFGLCHADYVDKLSVYWPVSNTTQTFVHVAANQIVEVREGSDQLTVKHYPSIDARSYVTLAE